MESKYIKYKTKLLGLKASQVKIQTYLQLGGSNPTEIQSERIKALIATLKNKSSEITTKLNISSSIHTQNKESIDELLKKQEEIENKLKEHVSALKEKNSIYEEYNLKLIQNLKELNIKLDEYKLEKQTLENAKNEINSLIADLIQNSSASSKDIEELKEKHEKEINDLEKEINEILSNLGETSESVQNTSTELLKPKVATAVGGKFDKNYLGGSDTSLQQQETTGILTTQQKLQNQLAIITQYIEQLEEKIDNIKSPYANDDNDMVKKFNQNTKEINTKLNTIESDLIKIKDEQDKLEDKHYHKLRGIISDGNRELTKIKFNILSPEIRAAIKIQSVFRGRKARKEFKRTLTNSYGGKLMLDNINDLNELSIISIDL
jgi:predicted  nucleic acid-binding Zn-ribbon protein